MLSSKLTKGGKVVNFKGTLTSPNIIKKYQGKLITKNSAKVNSVKKASGAKVPKISTLTETEQLKLANQYKKKSPINIPENANIKAQSKNGYEQISYKWKENEETIEVRWHTRTPGAPEGQGNTFVVEKKIHGTPDGQKKGTTNNGWQK